MLHYGLFHKYLITIKSRWSWESKKLDFFPTFLMLRNNGFLRKKNRKLIWWLTCDLLFAIFRLPNIGTDKNIFWNQMRIWRNQLISQRNSPISPHLHADQSDSPSDHGHCHSHGLKKALHTCEWLSTWTEKRRKNFFPERKAHFTVDDVIGWLLCVVVSKCKNIYNYIYKYRSMRESQENFITFRSSVSDEHRKRPEKYSKFAC